MALISAAASFTVVLAVTLTVYSRNQPVQRVRRASGYVRSCGGVFDLSDELMLQWPHASRTVIVGLKVESLRWQIWDERRVAHIEHAIVDDLTFDGYRPTGERLTSLGAKCNTEFRWRLRISVDFSRAPFSVPFRSAKPDRLYSERSRLTGAASSHDG
jgi:hypothetical protein